jgi:hypothetical protein
MKQSAQPKSNWSSKTNSIFAQQPQGWPQRQQQMLARSMALNMGPIPGRGAISLSVFAHAKAVLKLLPPSVRSILQGPDQEVSQYRSVVGSVPLRKAACGSWIGWIINPLKAVGHHNPQSGATTLTNSIITKGRPRRPKGQGLSPDG